MSQYRNRNTELKRYINIGVAFTWICEFIGFIMLIYMLVMFVYIVG